MTGRIVLAPRGFPWRSLLAGAAAIGLCMTVAMGVVGAASAGGALVVSALIGIGVFAATLG